MTDTPASEVTVEDIREYRKTRTFAHIPSTVKRMELGVAGFVKSDGVVVYFMDDGTLEGVVPNRPDGPGSAA